jgi:hypothetical protein
VTKNAQAKKVWPQQLSKWMVQGMRPSLYDVKNRRVHVAGRDLHFMCGATAVEDLHCQEFRLSRLARRNFCMYPEERSGYELNSASSMGTDRWCLFPNSAMYEFSASGIQLRILSYATVSVLFRILEGVHQQLSFLTYTDS